MLIKLEELSKMIDHSLLHPTMGHEELKRGCEIAMKYNVATVCVKPYAIQDTKKLLVNSDVKICSVVGFPHGNSKLVIKVKEAREACNDGADEIDMVINIAKAIEKDFKYIKKEIKTIYQVAKDNNVKLKIIFENDFLSDDIKIELCNICVDLKVDFIKTSTGYGFVKQVTGNYSYKGATEKDLKLMLKESKGLIQVKAAGGIRTLSELLYVKSLGVTRIGCTTTESIMKAAKTVIQKGHDFESLIPRSLSISSEY